MRRRWFVRTGNRFVAWVTGRSMEPLIPDGSWWQFRRCPAGSREGRIVLVQLANDGAGGGGGRFTAKNDHSEKRVAVDGWRHKRVWLMPLNTDFEPIEIPPEDAAGITLVRELESRLAASP